MSSPHHKFCEIIGYGVCTCSYWEHQDRLVQDAYASGYSDGWGRYNSKNLEINENGELISV